MASAQRSTSLLRCYDIDIGCSEDAPAAAGTGGLYQKIYGAPKTTEVSKPAVRRLCQQSSVGPAPQTAVVRPYSATTRYQRGPLANNYVTTHRQPSSYGDYSVSGRNSWQFTTLGSREPEESHQASKTQPPTMRYGGDTVRGRLSTTTEMRFIDDNAHAGDGNVLVDEAGLQLPRIGHAATTVTPFMNSIRTTVTKLPPPTAAEPAPQLAVARLCQRGQTPVTRAESRATVLPDFLASSMTSARWRVSANIDAKPSTGSVIERGGVGFLRTAHSNTVSAGGPINVSETGSRRDTVSTAPKQIRPSDTPKLECTVMSDTNTLPVWRKSRLDNMDWGKKPSVPSISPELPYDSAMSRLSGVSSHDDTGIDSSHSATSSVDYRVSGAGGGLPETGGSSCYSSLDSLQIERSQAGSSVGQTSPVGQPPSPAGAAVLSTSGGDVIRRKLSAHSKMKCRRTSTLLADPTNNDTDNKPDENNNIDRTTLCSERRQADEISSARRRQDDDVDDEELADEANNQLDSDFMPLGRSSLVVRQQPALRVKAIIDKLLYMSGRDQRQALFSLKSIFQNDKDIVQEFVRNGGLECLVGIGRSSDQNHQNHILRAIGQLMLYVDGMNGIIASNDTIGWLYELLDSQYRLVVKTTLKLLLVFVEYVDSNSLLLLAAVSRVEKSRGRPKWYSLMRILNDRLASDEETLVYGMAVVNKTLNGVSDQDTFFDIVDVLESQGLEEALAAMLRLNNPQLAQQCAHYEQELRKEDAALVTEGDASTTNGGGTGNCYSASNHFRHSPVSGSGVVNGDLKLNGVDEAVRMRTNGTTRNANDNDNNPYSNGGVFGNGHSVDRRSDWLRKQREHLEMTGEALPKARELCGAKIHNNNTITQQQNGYYSEDRKITDASPTLLTFVEKQQPQQQQNGLRSQNGYARDDNPPPAAPPAAERARPPPKISLYDSAPLDAAKESADKSDVESTAGADERPNVKAPPPCIPTNIFSPTEPKTMEFPPPPPASATQTAKFQSPAVASSAGADSDEEEDGVGCAGGFAAMLQKRAKKMENSAFRRGIVENASRQSESELKWKEAAEKLKEKPMIINDLDFSGFVEFEQDPLVLVKVAQVGQSEDGGGGGSPPAPPPSFPGARGAPPPPPPAVGVNGLARGTATATSATAARSDATGGTLKLHWKPAQADAPPVPALRQKGTFWNQMEITPQIDISTLSRLFEQKPKELPIKKAGGDSKPQVLQVLSVKRSQAINIGLTKLPPISVIPLAIKKFDASVLNKEGIEKILGTMMPSVEEVERIREAQADNPATPLGPAEQFMLSLSEIDCLLERLRLWLFMLDYHNLEKDVAEALMELNNAMKEIEESKTFRVAMGMLLSIGNALNGTDIKAFQLDYLGRASEVKDPVHKYPLTHHLAEYMLDHYPDGTDLYSELGAVSRSSRLDFDAVLDNLKKMETDCKSCFDYVAKISQRDNNSSMKNKVNSFLTEVAERIHRLKHVQRTTTHRWNAFLLYFGYAPAEVKEQKPIVVFKMVIEFALEYRTNRDKILQMRKRMAEKRERNKTRGMMIGAAQASANANDAAAGAQSGASTRRQRNAAANGGGGAEALMTDRERHQEMSRLLTNGNNSSTLGRRRAGQPTTADEALDGLRKTGANDSVAASAVTVSAADCADDELLDGVVRTVTAQADSRDHNRRRARLFNRKSRESVTLSVSTCQTEEQFEKNDLSPADKNDSSGSIAGA